MIYKIIDVGNGIATGFKGAGIFTLIITMLVVFFEPLISLAGFNINIFSAISGITVNLSDNTQAIFTLANGERTIIYFSFFVATIFCSLFSIIYKNNSLYIVNIDENKMTFPRSDMANSIIGVLLLSQFWGILFRREVLLSSVEDIYIESSRKGPGGKFEHKANLVGSFGSANFTFSQKQKRDELRNAVRQALKATKRLSGTDLGFDS